MFYRIVPILLHIILGAVAVGIAVGCNQEQVRPMIQYPLNGLAVGIVVTCLARVFVIGK